MAATPTVTHHPQFRKSTETIDPSQLGPERITPRQGVVTLFGYGTSVRVQRGHLVVYEAIGNERREGRFARVGHGLKRLVLIGTEGIVSIAALRWLSDQDVALALIERDGRVHTVIGPVRPSDARLRRAQALALRSNVGLEIARTLIDKKLAGQQQVARDKLHKPEAGNAIAHFRKALATAKTIEAVAVLESQAAAEYWAAWEGLSVTFPKSELRRVPEHWHVFSGRTSPISGSQRLAATPLNAILNYCYAILEAESRLAASAMGLDPGLGFLHLDTKARDSLACDLMEPVRPQVDAFVLEWSTRAALKREWFFEQRNGNCRLMAQFAAQLSETASMWRRAVAPFAEFVAQTLWSTIRKSDRDPSPATRLTQRRKREVKGLSETLPTSPIAQPQSVCRICGKSLSAGRRLCRSCHAQSAAEELVKAGPIGRMAAHTTEVEARRAETQRLNIAAQRSWDPSSQPAWLTEETYATKIQPLLAKVPTSAISTALGVSWVYAKYIRLGTSRPHPRHWLALAQLVGVSAGGSLGPI